MIDLGAKVDINAIRIAWADPYATRYYVQFWTGEQEPFYDGINKGAWQTFPMGAIVNGKGGTPTLKLVSWKIPARYLRIWMTESSNTCDTHGPQDQPQLRRLRYQRTLHRHHLRATASSTTSSSTCRAASRPSPGRHRWTRGTPLPISITAAEIRSGSTSSSTAA